MPGSKQAGDVLADRYRLEDLLTETRGGRSWRAHDSVLHRPVSVQIIGCDDSRADEVLSAARRMGPLADRRVLRVLDADKTESVCYVVSEWGQGESLDSLLLREGPLPPRRAAWVVSEVADSIARAHDVGLTHGRLVPENVLIDHHGHVRIIGFGVESALHGAPPAPVPTDVTDLAALLHAALTGKWAGRSTSQLPPAPLDQGRVLRPRRVRAGIPRQLDAVCDEVLNAGESTRPGAPRRSESDLSTARGIADALADFVGDPTDLQDTAPPPHVWTRSALQSSTPAPALSPNVGRGTGADTGSPPEPSPPTTDPHPPVSGPPPVSADLATQAGMPVFHDDTEDVEWLRARAETPPPPPPLEPARPKPLFAPDPPEGEPVRRPRPGAAAAAAAKGDYWPWESGATDSGGTGSGTDGWRVDSGGTGHDTGDTDIHVPGQSWIRLAMLIAFATMVLIAAVAAWQLGVGSPPETPLDPDSDATTEAAGPPTPFADVSATDFDPQGSEPREENPELVPLAIDGDTSTSWRTATYRQNFGPAGLKTGVGLVVDLGATRDVREVAVTVEDGRTSVAAYVTESSPTGVADLTRAGEATGDGEVTITLDEAVSGQFVTVWLTSLPQVSDGFRGTIAEIEVRG